MAGIRNFGSMLVFDHALAPLASRNSDDIGLGLIEAIEDCPHGIAQGDVEKSLSINAEQVSAGVLEGHTLTVVVNTVPPLIVFEVVPQAVKDAAEIFGGPAVAEGNKFQQRVKWQRRQREIRPSFDRSGHGVRYDVTEACHVEDYPVFELQTSIRRHRRAER